MNFERRVAVELERDRHCILFLVSDELAAASDRLVLMSPLPSKEAVANE